MTGIDKRSWPSNPAEWDFAVAAQFVGAAAKTVVPIEKDASLESVAGELRAFLDVHSPRCILVKTSTAGGRAASHEISPQLLASVLDAVIETAPEAIVMVGDGPAYARYQDECARLGWAGPIGERKCSIVDLNLDVPVYLQNGLAISSSFAEADCVISLTRAKTHSRAGVSFGLKSLIGVLNGNVTGYPKLAGHHRDLLWIMAELERISPPVFSLIDGREGIEGEGPMSGTCTPSCFVTFGRGWFVPDVIAAVQMGFDPALVPCFQRPFEISRKTHPAVLPWAKQRAAFFDFLPSRSCSWLYKSLDEQARRTNRFRQLSESAQECWPKTTSN